MKRSVVVVAALFLGCSEPTQPGARGTVEVKPLIALQAIGTPGSEVSDLPAVRITDFPGRRPLEGRTVVFTMVSPDGSKTAVTRLTDSDGIASLPSWRLGSEPGLYTATAVTDGWGPVIFTVYVPGDPVAIYDLKSINGQSIPFNDSWGREVHYVLYAGGVFNRFVHVPEESFTLLEEFFGTYTRPDAETIVLKMTCWQVFQSRCIAGGRGAAVSGDEMIIDDSDFGPWIERYVLRTTSEGT